MAQSGGVRKRKYKDVLFSRKVVLIKSDNEHTTFSDMNKIESKSEIEFLTSMNQNDVQKKIQETFPYLEYKRFFCAAFLKVDNDHKKFEYHGSPRVWDGKTIKRHIKGKSNLYILEEEVVHSTSTCTVTTHDSNSTERTPSTSAHNIADSSHQSGGQANNINALLSGEQALLNQNILELQMLHSEHDEGAMEVEQENQQEGASALTNTGNLDIFHANGATKLQNSVIPVNESPLEQAAVMTSQQGFNVMPGCSTHNKYTAAAAAAPEGQVGTSDCRLSSSDDDNTPTSGISESDVEFSEKIEDNNNADARPNLSSSDTGFDEGMDIDHGPHLDAIKNEEDIPFSQHHVISMVAPSHSDGISDETSDDVVQQDPLEAAVQDTCCMNPKSGSVEGGYPFHMTVTELPNDLTTAIVRFHGVFDVRAEKLNSSTLSGIVPLSLVYGDVQVTAMRDLETGHVLGMTCFKYVDEVVRTVEELVKDRNKLYQTFVCWVKESGLLQSDSNISESLDQDSSSQTKQKHLNVLQLLVYTAAQTDAQQFLEMIFSTSAGQIVFNSYKDRTPLPEDIARANGHEDLAHFLQDINTRLSKETSGNVQNNAIDWLELVKAVQKQASAVQDESTKQLNQSENDDNSSDYFADAETSSCGSFDRDTGWSDISEDNGPCIRDAESIQGPTEKPEEGTPNKKPVKKWAQLDNEGDKENVSIWGLTHSFPEWLSKWQKSKDTSSMQQGKGDGSTETNSTSKIPKKRESTPEKPASNNFQCTVTHNRRIQASMIELRMERVRSWLACDLGQEEPPSEDGGGNTDGTLNSGNHEANRELDLQNQEQGHPSALSFNKGNMARADQHQDFDVPGSLTDKIDENGSITSETGAVEVSDECSSSSEEEFFTSEISEGDFVVKEGINMLVHVIEEDTRCIHSIADRMAQVCTTMFDGMPAYSQFLVFIHRLLQEQLFQHKGTDCYVAEAFAKDCLEILKCSATLSLQKKAFQILHLLVRKHCRGNNQQRDLEREPTEQRAVGGQPSDEVNHAIVPRRLTATGFQKQSRGAPVSGLLLQELNQSETDPTKRLSLVKQSAVNDEAVNDSCLDCIDCFVRDDSPVDEHLNKLEDDVTLFNILGIASSVDDEALSPMEQLPADIHNLHSLDQPVIHKDIKGKDVLLHVIDEDTRCIHSIADGMAQVCTRKVAVFPLCDSLLLLIFFEQGHPTMLVWNEMRTLRYLAEVFARDCQEILKCSATLSLQKEACQRLRLLIGKYYRCRKRKSTETRFQDH